MAKWSLSLVLLFALPMTLSADTGKDEIVKLAKAGIGDEIILAFVKRNPLFHKLTSDDIIELKKAGVSDTVLNSLLASPPVEKTPVPAKVRVVAQPKSVEKIYVTAPVYYSSPTYPSYVRTYRSYSGCGPVRYSSSNYYYTPRYSRPARNSYRVNWCW